MTGTSSFEMLTTACFWFLAAVSRWSFRLGDDCCFSTGAAKHESNDARAAVESRI